MRRHLLDLIVMFFFISLVSGYVALAQPSLRNVTLHAFVFLVGGLLMLGLVAAAGDRVPHRHRSDARRGPRSREARGRSSCPRSRSCSAR